MARSPAVPVSRFGPFVVSTCVVLQRADPERTGVLVGLQGPLRERGPPVSSPRTVVECRPEPGMSPDWNHPRSHARKRRRAALRAAVCARWPRPGPAVRCRRSRRCTTRSWRIRPARAGVGRGATTRRPPDRRDRPVNRASGGIMRLGQLAPLRSAQTRPRLAGGAVVGARRGRPRRSGRPTSRGSAPAPAAAVLPPWRRSENRVSRRLRPGRARLSSRRPLRPAASCRDRHTPRRSQCARLFCACVLTVQARRVTGRPSGLGTTGGPGPAARDCRALRAIRWLRDNESPGC